MFLVFKLISRVVTVSTQMLTLSFQMYVWSHRILHTCNITLDLLSNKKLQLHLIQMKFFLFSSFNLLYQTQRGQEKSLTSLCSDKFSEIWSFLLFNFFLLFSLPPHPFTLKQAAVPVTLSNISVLSADLTLENTHSKYGLLFYSYFLIFIINPFSAVSVFFVHCVALDNKSQEQKKKNHIIILETNYRTKNGHFI